MDNLANMLTGQVGLPVIDTTGLTGKYALTLSWYLETSSPAADTFGGPTIFKAIQDQLGLKLEPKKGAVEMLVVDHVERAPIEN